MGVAFSFFTANPAVSLGAAAGFHQNPDVMSILNRTLMGALAGAALAFTSPTQAAAQGVKNVVFVHGAFADGSSWAKVIPLLEAKGLHVICVQNPLTSLADDVAATKRAIALADGPVLLVGHSWGGMVISAAGNDPKVVGLVYESAAVPEPNQSLAELFKPAPTPGLKQVKPDAAGFLSMTPQGINEDFAPDLTSTERQVMVASQQPIAGAAFKDKIPTVAWQTKPSWYIITSNDRMMSPALQQTLAKKMKATTLTLVSSHVAMLSHPKEVATFIAEAAKKVPVK